MPEDYILHVLKNILKGLEFAHERGALHLDLKPENIFLKKDGSVKIGDFGCVKKLH